MNKKRKSNKEELDIDFQDITYDEIVKFQGIVMEEQTKFQSQLEKKFRDLFFTKTK